MKPHLSLQVRGRKKKDSDKKNGKSRRIDFQRAGLAVLTIVVLSVVLCIPLLPDRIQLVPGDVAPEDIRAPMPVSYLNTAEYDRQRNRAEAMVEKVYGRARIASEESMNSLSGEFRSISAARDDQTLKTADEKGAHARAELKKRLGIEVPLDSLLVLVKSPERMLGDVRDVTVRLVRETMSEDIKDDDPVGISRMRRHVFDAAKEDLGNTSYAVAASDLANAVIRPNMIFQKDKTNEERKRAVAAVKPVYGFISSGELIIEKGQRVTQEHVDKFTALGLRQRRIDYHTVLSLAALVSFLVGLVLIYLARYQEQIYKTTRLLAMLSLVVVVSTICLKLGGGMLGIKLSGLQLAYVGMIFTTAAGMILASLLNPQLAVLIVAMLSIVSGFVMNFELRYATSTLISGLVAIYAVANIRGRVDLVRAFAAIAVTNIAITWILGGLFGDSVVDMAFGSVWSVLVIAFLATSIFWYGTWALERPFRATTHISLLELADTNKPILRRLVVEAPGTYTHSMAVGHLAEAAAEAIGADSLFARVASYYHDIGKIRRPHFFVENQQMENVHDRLSPTLSALVITSHINDGIEVA
jgi:putative nucleotidyltransferase with HDIG domain